MRRSSSTAPSLDELYLGLTSASTPSGGTLLQGVAGTVAGSVNAFDFTAAATTGNVGIVRNGNTTDGTAHAQFRAQSGGASGGDPFFEWKINTVNLSVVAGIDNSDSDKWKLAYNSQALGTNDVLAIDASKVAFFIAPKLPSYTVAGAPSAATLGAGAAIYVSDESGGATLAFSDGTNWKRVSDLATIS